MKCLYCGKETGSEHSNECEECVERIKKEATSFYGKQCLKELVANHGKL